MRGILKLMSLRLINENTPLFNLYSSSPPAASRAGLWVFVPCMVKVKIFYLKKLEL